MTERYQDYKELRIERKGNGILLITMNRPEVLNVTTYSMHAEMARIWDDVDRDRAVKVAVITGAGQAFCSGNDPNNPVPDHDMVREIIADALKIVRGMVECEKPIISAINGAAVGAGLAVAVLADISIAADDARLIDNHIMHGVTAGDHACLIWPLLCGLARAKLYLMNLEPLTGKVAERIGIVSMSVPKDQVVPKALEYAERLAAMSQPAIRGTKRALNGWLRQAMPIMEHSAALEMFDYVGPDVEEARQASREKRAVRFPSAQ